MDDRAYYGLDEDDEPEELPMEATWPDWRCTECNTFNAGFRYVCAMCGTVREDADNL